MHACVRNCIRITLDFFLSVTLLHSCVRKFPGPVSFCRFAMPAPAHLLDSLGRCGVVSIVSAFYVLLFIAMIVGIVGPATLSTPTTALVSPAPCPAPVVSCPAASQRFTISGLATYNQFVAVMATVQVPYSSGSHEPIISDNEDRGYSQVYSLRATGVDTSGTETLLANSNHTVYLDFESGQASAPSFLIAYYPQ